MECLIKIKYGRFFVALRQFFRLVRQSLWLIYNLKRSFYWGTIFLWKMADFFSLLVWLWSISWLTSRCVTLGSGLSMLELWSVASVLQGEFCVIIGCKGKFFGSFEGTLVNTRQMEMFWMPGESDLVESCIFRRSAGDLSQVSQEVHNSAISRELLVGLFFQDYSHGPKWDYTLWQWSFIRLWSPLFWLLLVFF